MPRTLVPLSLEVEHISLLFYSWELFFVWGLMWVTPEDRWNQLKKSLGWRTPYEVFHEKEAA